MSHYHLTSPEKSIISSYLKTANEVWIACGKWKKIWEWNYKNVTIKFLEI